jgi:hypothetical protein
MAGGDCNTLRTLVCVCQWSVKCNSEWCTQVVNISNSPIQTPPIVALLKTWRYIQLPDYHSKKPDIQYTSHNLTVICEQTVLKMWQPWRFTTLLASTACYLRPLYLKEQTICMKITKPDLKQCKMSCLQKWVQAHTDMLFPKNVCPNIINSALQNADAVLILSDQTMVQKCMYV